MGQQAKRVTGARSRDCVAKTPDIDEKTLCTASRRANAQ